MRSMLSISNHLGLPWLIFHLWLSQHLPTVHINKVAVQILNSITFSTTVRTSVVGERHIVPVQTNMLAFGVGWTRGWLWRGWAWSWAGVERFIRRVESTHLLGCVRVNLRLTVALAEVVPSRLDIAGVPRGRSVVFGWTHDDGWMSLVTVIVVEIELRVVYSKFCLCL